MYYVLYCLLGRQLEETGVLSESLRSRSNSWGLHMPLVCPDGAVVAYAWKRQLAGQAGASAVDRTRLDRLSHGLLLIFNGGPNVNGESTKIGFRNFRW